MLFLRFGGAGGMIAAWRRSKPYRRAGVVAAGERERFYSRCVKGTSPSFRAAYALFLEGRISSASLAEEGVRGASARRMPILFGVAGVGVIASLLVFLTFYFRVPIGETMLRTAICAFHGAIAAVSSGFFSCEYYARAEKAASRFAASLDGLLLRERPSGSESHPAEPSVSIPLPKPRSTASAVSEDRCAVRTSRAKVGLTEKEDGDLADLKRLLRELDSVPKAT